MVKGFVALKRVQIKRKCREMQWPSLRPRASYGSHKHRFVFGCSEYVGCAKCPTATHLRLN